MTNQEASKIIKDGIEDMSLDFADEEQYEALTMAIKALEQEPSGDAVSRQAVIDAFGLSEKTRKYGGDHSGYDTVMKYEIQDVLEDLPPVTTQPKTGYISIDDVMSVFDDFMCGEDEEAETFLEMLKDKLAENEVEE